MTLRKVGLCGCLPELRLGRREGRLVGPWIDDEKQIALLDDLPVGEVDLGQIAAHPGADFDRVLRPELAGELVPLDQLAL